MHEDSSAGMEALRTNFVHLLQMLASPNEQDVYQEEVDDLHIDIRDELLCMWFDDFWGHGQREHMIPCLSEEELNAVDTFHAFFEARDELLPETYAELRESPIWHEIVRKAQETLVTLGWDRIPTVPAFGATPSA